MVNRKLWFNVVMALLMVLLLVGCAQSAEPATKTVTLPVAVIMDHTGTSAALSIHAYRGVTQYLSWLNDNGGIDGTTIDFLWADSQYKMLLASSAYQRFRDQGVVLTFLYATPDGLAVAPLAKDDNMAIINGSRFTALLKPPSVTFAPGAAYGTQASVVLRWFLEKWDQPRKPRLGWIIIDAAAGQAVGEGFPWLKENLKKDDGLTYEWLEDVKYPPANPSFRTQIEQMMKQNPDLVCCGSPANQTGQIWRDAYEMGITNVPIVAPGTIPSGIEALKVAGPEASEGKIMVISYATIEETNITGVNVVREAMKKYQGEIYDDQSYMEGWVMGAIGVEAIRIAIKKVGAANVTRQDVLEAMQEINDLEVGGVSPPISFAKDRRIGQNFLRLQQVQNGKPKVITDWIECLPCIPGLN